MSYCKNNELLFSFATQFTGEYFTRKRSNDFSEEIFIILI